MLNTFTTTPNVHVTDCCFSFVMWLFEYKLCEIKIVRFSVVSLYNVLPPPTIAPKIYRTRQYLFIVYVGAIFYAFCIFLLSVSLCFPLSLLTRDPISLHNLTTILCNLKCVLLHVIMCKRSLLLFTLIILPRV